jgi:hypothetical protein
MLVVIAEGHDKGLELTARRDRFKCTRFFHTVA